MKHGSNEVLEGGGMSDYMKLWFIGIPLLFLFFYGVAYMSRNDRGW